VRARKGSLSVCYLYRSIRWDDGDTSRLLHDVCSVQGATCTRKAQLCVRASVCSLQALQLLEVGMGRDSGAKGRGGSGVS